MGNLGNRLKLITDVSTTHKVVVIISLFVFISLVLAGVIYIQSNIFNGVRSYVRGEGLWAKAQKDAVFYLSRYTYSRDFDDFLAFQKATQVNYGDHKARIALQQKPPDKLSAEQGFLQGRNHPDDIDSMIWFFLNFRQISYMREAIDIWSQGDRKIDELMVLGEEVRREIERGNPDTRRLKELRGRIDRLNDELVFLENQFSDVLGEGARWVKDTVWYTSVVLLALFLASGIFISRQIIKGIHQAEKALRLSEARFKSLRESRTIGIVAWDLNGRIIEANSLFWEMLGHNDHGMSGRSFNWRDMTPVTMHPRDDLAISELMQHGRCNPFEKALFHKDGHTVPIYMGASLLESGGHEGIAFVMDLSERKHFEEELQLASIIFANSHDGIMITDAERRIISANQALCQMTGYDEKELKGKKPQILGAGIASPDHCQRMNDSLERNGYWQGDVTDRMRTGELLPLRVSIRQVRNEKGEIIHYVAILSDNTERKNLEEHLRHLAHHDPLTQLPNRSLLDNRIEWELNRAKRNSSKFALLFLDLDRFKPVNDIYGHKAGDRLLQIVAERLVNLVRESDTVARVGGDEFVILLEDITDASQVDLMCEKVIYEISRPCIIESKEIDIGVSIGYSLYPDDGTDMQKLIRHADENMYSMKARV